MGLSKPILGLAAAELKKKEEVTLGRLDTESAGLEGGLGSALESVSVTLGEGGIEEYSAKPELALRAIILPVVGRTRKDDVVE